MRHCITVLPQKQNIEAKSGENLLQVLRREGFFVNAACGGNGSCGKCRVWLDGQEVLACRTVINRDLTLTLPAAESAQILTDGIAQPTANLCTDGFCLAFDVGTTTVAGYLLDGKSGQELCCQSMRNPQVSYGADVISRIQSALHGYMEELTAAIGKCVASLADSLCQKAGISPDKITTVSLVGNPAMQQLFLGIRPDNLAQIPFAPALTQAKTVKAKDYLPLCKNAELLIVPNISGFVGADTLGCILATGLHEKEELSLLVDIGTNGEMVLGNKHRMVACATAAGPALEGAHIQFGMGAQTGAIDHVWLENGQLHCSVIGSGEAVGICGSGIIDAVAAALDAGWINQQGKILRENPRIALTDRICLTKEDIRQVQLAKGAIAAGIQLMMAHLDVELQDIEHIYLAGAFGSYMDAASACRMGLLPPLPEEKITAVGNAAGSGAKMLACSPGAFAFTQTLTGQIQLLELASVPGFQRCFANNMRFYDIPSYWCQKAMALGFSNAVPLNISTLQPRQDVRDMCAADKCGAYGKNWTCPPHCGTLADCQQQMQRFERGILVQTTGTLQKTVDTKAYRQTEQQHLQQFYALAAAIRKYYPQALCLGSGGCRVCFQCAFPEPCRFPEKACSSMEAYGLFVTQVCKDNSLAYYHGEKTVTYTACILF